MTIHKYLPNVMILSLSKKKRSKTFPKRENIKKLALSRQA